MPNKRLENFRFEPIRGYRVFEDVLDQLTYSIRSGVYEPGDRLPPLEELAQAMNTSRPSVSEAVGLLVSAGVVETKRGQSGGTVVKTSVVPRSVLGFSLSPSTFSPGPARGAAPDRPCSRGARGSTSHRGEFRGDPRDDRHAPSRPAQPAGLGARERPVPLRGRQGGEELSAGHVLSSDHGATRYIAGLLRRALRPLRPHCLGPHRDLGRATVGATPPGSPR